MSNIFNGRPSNPAGLGNVGVDKSTHDLGVTQIADKKALLRSAQVEVLAGSKICGALREVPSKHIWVMNYIERIVERPRGHLTS